MKDFTFKIVHPIAGLVYTLFPEDDADITYKGELAYFHNFALYYPEGDMDTTTNRDWPYAFPLSGVHVHWVEA